MDVLVIDGSELHVGPARLAHSQPRTEGLEAPLEHPFRLFLLLRDDSNDVLVEPLGNRVGVDLGYETPTIFFVDALLDRVAR